MSLQEKVLKLKLEAVVAARHAQFWETAIATHGEAKTTAFYKSIGLNHLESKSIEWEGLTLSRQPNEAEKLCVKGIAGAQEAGKASVGTVLMEARAALIDDGLKAIKRLKPVAYHELILAVPGKVKRALRDELGEVFDRGRSLIRAELEAQDRKSWNMKQATEGDESELDDMADLASGRMSNETQARITSAAARFALLGLTGAALWDAVAKELSDGSTGWVDRIATGTANKVLNFGRYREMQERRDDIGRYEYSALLDQNTCGPCFADDGKEASSPDDLPDAPNPECEGSDFCRCFIVTILDTVA